MSGRPDADVTRVDDGEMRWVPLADEPCQRHKRELQAGLEREFPEVSSEAIGQLVEVAWARTDGAAVHQFRTILAERHCRDALRNRAANVHRETSLRPGANRMAT